MATWQYISRRVHFRFYVGVVRQEIDSRSFVIVVNSHRIVNHHQSIIDRGNGNKQGIFFTSIVRITNIKYYRILAIIIFAWVVGIRNVSKGNITMKCVAK